MQTLSLTPTPISSELFAPYGDVISTDDRASTAMNAAFFDRFDDLATIDVGDGEVTMGIVTSRLVSELPYRIELVERHPHGSQAFVPLQHTPMFVVVAPASDQVQAQDLRAFVTDGQQGINYHPGTWHMPLIALAPGQRFLVVDRAAGQPNCDEVRLANPPLLLGDPAA